MERVTSGFHGFPVLTTKFYRSLSNHAVEKKLHHVVGTQLLEMLLAFAEYCGFFFHQVRCPTSLSHSVNRATQSCLQWLSWPQLWILEWQALLLKLL